MIFSVTVCLIDSKSNRAVRQSWNLKIMNFEIIFFSIVRKPYCELNQIEIKLYPEFFSSRKHVNILSRLQSGVNTK